MNRATLSRIGAAGVVVTLGWLLGGAAAALLGAIPALWVGYGTAAGFTVATIALGTGSPPARTTPRGGLGAATALSGLVWLVVGGLTYATAAVAWPVAVGLASLVVGLAVFARYDPDRGPVDDREDG